MSAVQAVAIGTGIVLSTIFLVLSIREIGAARQYDIRIAKARAEIERLRRPRAPESPQK